MHRATDNPATGSPANPAQPAAPFVATAACLAGKLGLTVQAVRKILTGVPPCATVTIKGQRASAWTLAALPQALRRRIASARQLRCFRTDAAFLASTVEPCAPPKPFNQLPAAAQLEAAQWRDILSPLLARQHTTAPAELLADGLAGAQRILGAKISADTFRRRFDLAVDRDNSFEQWQNLDLYVPPAAYQSAPALAAPVLIVPPSGLWPDLPDRLDELENKLNPTAEDRAHLFDAAFRQLDTLLAANFGTVRETKLKRRLAEILRQAVPARAKTEASFRRNFERKLTTWRTNGRTLAAILDARDNSGPTAKKLCPTCRELVKGAAVSLDGDLAQAWRRLQLPPQLGGIRAEGKGLCDVCAGLWHFNVRQNKSYVPHSLRADLGPEVEALLVQRHGRKAAKLASPYVRRDWSDIGPGDWFEADDVTLNHAFYLWAEDGSGRPYVGRGECLVLADSRTDYLVGHMMIAGEVDEEGRQIAARYNAGHIRRMVLRGHDSIGLPHTGFLFENSVWAARLVDGTPLRKWEFNGWRRTEHGLRDPRLGLIVDHTEARNPRTKIIEGIFNRIQNRMRPQSGFVGFNERTDAREKMQDFLRRVRAGKEHPGNELLSMAEFMGQLDAEIMDFVREPQNGQRLPGVSPMEAWLNGIGGKPGIHARPVRKLPNGARHLLATHRRLVPVTGQGIRLRIGSGPARVFWDDALLPFQHRQLAVAINLEEPELLHCLPEQGEPFTLRERLLPSRTATREQLAETSAARRRWVKAGKIAFDNLPHPLRINIVRDGQQDAATQAEGEFINRATEQHRETQRQEGRQKARIARLATALAAPVVINPHRASQQEEALRRMQERRRAAASQISTEFAP